MNRLFTLFNCLVAIFLLAGCGSISLSGEFSLEGLNTDVYYAETGPGQFDLDTGSFDNKGQGDIMLTEGAGSARFITLYPPNDAKARYFGTEPPDIEDCRGVLAETLGGAVPQIAVGGYICVLTTEGNVARLLIEELDSGFPATMRISYTLWFVEDQ